MIRTEERIVAFVDILGFSNLIKEYDKEHKDEVLNNLHDAVHSSVQILQHSFPATNDISRQWDVKKYLEVKLFSDCLCISTPVQHESLNFYYHFRFFYMYLATYQVVLMEKGYFVRGGMTIGSYYSDDLMIFSGGLVEAYELEHTHANTPRILVAEKVLEPLKPFMSTENSVAINRMIAIDKADNRPFINPFNYLRVTAPDADKMAQEFINRIGIPGIMDTFEDAERNAMENLIKKVEAKISAEKAKNTGITKVLSKYEWLEDLIQYCKTEEQTKFKNLY